jgi:hypothetical protein
MRLSDKGFTPLQMNSFFAAFRKFTPLEKAAEFIRRLSPLKIFKKNIFLSVTGLTLLELMITSAILLIAICGLLVTFASCILMNESNDNLVVAANDAQYVLEEIKALPYADIQDYSPPALDNLQGEAITLNKDIGTQITEVTVNVNWTERQRNKAVSLSTRIAK